MKVGLSEKYSKALTWSDLAHIYNKAHPGGRPAQTLKMETVYNWVSKQPGYKVAEDGTIHKL